MSGFSWNWALVWNMIPSLLDGLQVTVLITLVATALSLVIGLIFTIIRLAEVPVFSPVITAIVQVLRGTPLLIQLYLLFFVLPDYGITLSPIMTGIVALAFYNGAMASEIFRAGIQNVPRTQWEASLSLSLPLPWIWTRVVLPQAIRSVIPMLGNLLVVMFKETALLSAIAVTEVLASARHVAQEHYRFIEPYTTVAVMFFIVSYISVLGLRRLEKWSNKNG